MNNLPLQPLIWQDLDEDPMLAPVSISESPLHHYVVLKDGEGIKVRYSKKGADFDYATGFATIHEAKTWAWNHYNEKMQPYVKPMPTWIDASERLPKQDGLYLALRKGFTFEMGNASDLVPQVSGWNGGRGCFDDDYGNVLITHWMPIPEFSTMQNLHKGGGCE